jgi:hypothetical protein
MLDSHYEELFRLIMNDINDSVAREAYLERQAQGDFDDHRESDDEPIQPEDDPPIVSAGTLAQLKARK